MSDRVDELFRRFLAGMQGREPPPARTPLQLVTAENAAQFSQAPKRCGRPRKVPRGGNVVAFRQRPQPAPSEDRAITWMREMVRSIQRESAARGLQPAPDGDGAA